MNVYYTRRFLLIELNSILQKHKVQRRVKEVFNLPTDRQIIYYSELHCQQNYT